MLEEIKKLGYQVLPLSHAEAILNVDFPQALQEIEKCLIDFRIPIAEIIGSGGGEAQGTQRLRRSLTDQGWPKTNFEISKVINGMAKESISHEIDHTKQFDNKGTVALEIEWNNKDPFFDRDLENYKRLHAEGAISVGVIITRGEDLQNSMKDLVLGYAKKHEINNFDRLQQLGLTLTKRQHDDILEKVERPRNPVPFPDAWANLFVQDKFGAATTHWEKLKDRVDRGVGNPCPLLLIGIPKTIVLCD